MRNPFGAQDVPCIPTEPALFTRRMLVFAKGTMSTGSTDFGFVVMDPIMACHNDPSTVNAVTGNGFVLSSTAAYGGTVPSLIGAGVQTAFGNSDYLLNQFGVTNNLAQVRVVGAGLRARYIGTELSRGGQVLCFHDPNHESLIDNAKTFASVDGEDLSKKYPVNRNWHHVTYSVADNIDYQFIPSQLSGNILPVLTTDEMYPMGILFQSPTGVPAVYEWEAYVGLEIAGRNIRSKTLSNADSVGSAAAAVSGMIPYMNVGENPGMQAKQATQVADLHVRTQSGGTHAGINWEDALGKVLEKGVDYLPEIAAFALDLFL
jgi:hypothetical protein